MLISRSKSSPPTARVNAPGEAPYPNMSWIPGGTFRMGSEKYYPEERPVHRVTVYGFWIDCTPVTNREFHRFVETTGYVTFAEIQPDPKNYPDGLPEMLQAGSLVFIPPNHPVNLRDWGARWHYIFAANWRQPFGPRSSIRGLEDHPVGGRRLQGR
jgi:formylglycine-generating enzyme